MMRQLMNYKAIEGLIHHDWMHVASKFVRDSLFCGM